MSTKNSLEREIKFSGVDLEDLRQRLAELEAERVSAATFEDNWLLDRSGELEKKECILRLRVDGNASSLTYKGPPRFEERVKVRTEHETQVTSAPETRALFEALGYRVERRYQKMREEWQLGGVTIALDHTPIGDFVEFEGEGAEIVARRCGFDLETSERRTYLRLYADHRKEHPEAPRDMLFKDDTTEG